MYSQDPRDNSDTKTPQTAQSSQPTQSPQTNSSWSWSDFGSGVATVGLAVFGIFMLSQTDKKVLEDKSIGYYIGGKGNIVENCTEQGHDIGYASPGTGNTFRGNSSRK